MPTDVGKIPDTSLIAGKEFRNWVVKDLDPFSQAVRTVKKRSRNIVLSFSHDSVTTARLKTYNGHRAIGANGQEIKWAETDKGSLRTREKKELGDESRYASNFSLRKSSMGFYAAKTNINILDTLQNSLIRMIVKATRYMRNDDIRNALKITSFKAHVQKIAINFFDDLPATNNYNMQNLIPYIPNDNSKRPRRILLDSYNPP
ncbi:uncharacterized protein TNCV_2312221 [Trichonephila clavipes]|nr:uncharacterized protein TNCV_2312221 [Trichonephila clavipes]